MFSDFDTSRYLTLLDQFTHRFLLKTDEIVTLSAIRLKNSQQKTAYYIRQT